VKQIVINILKEYQDFAHQ